MNKIAVIIVSFLLLFSCSKKKNSESVNSDSLSQHTKVVISGNEKQYYLVKKIEKKEFSKGKTFKIEGNLKDQNNNTDFQNIELVLKDSTNQIVRRATVKSNGKFTFFKVEPKSYSIAIDTSTMLSLLDKYKIIKTEDFVKEDIDDKFQVGSKMSVSEVNDRFLANIYKDSLVKNNSTKISSELFHTSKKPLPKIVTYLLLDDKNVIARRVDWNSNVNHSFSQLFPKNYSLLILDPIPGAKAKIKYIENLQKDIAKIGNLKLGDVIDEKTIKTFTKYSFKADTLNKATFKGLLTKNGEVIDEGKLLLVDGNNKIVHEISTMQTGGFIFEGLDPAGTYSIVVPQKEKGYKITHTNPRVVHKADALDTLEQSLMKQKTIEEVLSQDNKPEVYEKDKVEKVLNRVESQLSENLSDAELYYKRGLLKYELQDYNGAIESFDKAIELKQDYSDAYYLRGESRDFMGDYEGAVRDFTKCLEFAPNNLSANYKRGVVRKDIGQPNESIDDLTKVINAYPNHHYPYFYRGLSKMQVNKFTEANNDFNKSLSIEPNLQEAYYNKGYANMQQKRYAEALTNLDKAIEMKPTDADAHLLRGQTKSILGKTAEANKDFDEAIRLNPDLEFAYYEKANLRFTEGDEAGAHKMYDEAVEKFNSEYRPYLQRGIFYYNIKDYVKSKTDLDKAAEQNKQDSYIYYYRALVNQKLKNKDLICDDAKTAMRLGFDDTQREMEAFQSKYCK